MMPPRLRWRLRSLRWRLTTFYVGLLSVLLLLGGVAQYFAAREVLFRSNADVLISEYTAVAQAFRKQLATRPAGTPTPIRALLLSQQFATELRSRRISAAIFDTNVPTDRRDNKGRVRGGPSCSTAVARFDMTEVPGGDGSLTGTRGGDVTPSPSALRSLQTDSRWRAATFASARGGSPSHHGAVRLACAGAWSPTHSPLTPTA